MSQILNHGSGGGGGGGQKVETTGPITITVTTTGNDNDSNRPDIITDGDYSLYPFLTIQAAIDALPTIINYYTLILVGAGTFAGFSVKDKIATMSTVDPDNGVTYSTQALQIIGTWQDITPATGSATGTLTGYGLTGGQALYKATIAAAGWTVNDLAGSWCRVTGGTGTPRSGSQIGALIESNTATEMYLTLDFSGAIVPTSWRSPASQPGVGSVVHISRPSTVLTYNAAVNASSNAIVSVLNVTGGVSIGVFATANTANLITFTQQSGNVFFHDIEGKASNLYHAAQFNIAAQFYNIECVGAALQLGSISNSSAIIQGCLFNGTGPTLIKSTPSLFLTGVIKGSGQDGIVIDGSNQVKINNCLISNNTLSGIKFVGTNARDSIFSNAMDIVNGTGNGTVGLDFETGTYDVRNNVVITGTSGDMSIAGAVTSYATLTATNPLIATGTVVFKV